MDYSVIVFGKTGAPHSLRDFEGDAAAAAQAFVIYVSGKAGYHVRGGQAVEPPTKYLLDGYNLIRAVKVIGLAERSSTIVRVWPVEPGSATIHWSEVTLEAVIERAGDDLRRAQQRLRVLDNTEDEAEPVVVAPGARRQRALVEAFGQ